MADSKKYDGSQWEHSLRKLTTATEAIENPLYTDGTAITAYTLKGNTAQNGTPTPSNPVDVNGVGDRTDNLFEGTLEQGGINGGDGTEFDSDYRVRSSFLQLDSGTYTISCSSNNIIAVFVYSGTTFVQMIGYNRSPLTFTLSARLNIRIGFSTSAGTTPIYPESITDIMLNSGSTAKPYEPYGFKIPILTAQGSAVNYLGNVQSTRQIKKLVLDGNEESWSRSTSYSGGFFSSWSNFGGMNYGAIYCSHAQYVSDITDYVSGTCYSDGSLNIRIMPEGSTVPQWREYLAQQYANGTPVTVWYVLATAEIAAVNEPLMKIGDYADTLSNAAAIPTTDGANSITVDTTVQPSEFSATWTGWHDSSVKEYDGTNWQ